MEREGAMDKWRCGEGRIESEAKSGEWVVVMETR
jgi:hypothetical protein